MNLYTDGVGRVVTILALLLVANAMFCVTTCSANEAVPAPPCHHQDAPKACAHAGFTAILHPAPIVAMDAPIELVPPIADPVVAFRPEYFVAPVSSPPLVFAILRI